MRQTVNPNRLRVLSVRVYSTKDGGDFFFLKLLVLGLTFHREQPGGVAMLAAGRVGYSRGGSSETSIRHLSENTLGVRPIISHPRAVPDRLCHWQELFQCPTLSLGYVALLIYGSSEMQ